jgi:hypothetical protein
MSDQRPPISGEMWKGGKATLELKPGEPFLGQEGPPGAKFLGWVLVQVWDVPEGRDGCVVQLSTTTGEHQRLMERAAAKLNQGWPGTH